VVAARVPSYQRLDFVACLLNTSYRVQKVAEGIRYAVIAPLNFAETFQKSSREGEEHCLTRSGSFLFGSGGHRLASVERGNEEDIVALLNLVFLFSFELPIGIVDEYENTRSSNGVSRIS
jgi:hypothetical protein